jgi:hypothetical protein
MIEHARELGIDLPTQLDDPDAELTPAVGSSRGLAAPPFTVT